MNRRDGEGDHAGATARIVPGWNFAAFSRVMAVPGQRSQAESGATPSRRAV
jgi:hypothetical protein